MSGTSPNSTERLLSSPAIVGHVAAPAFDHIELHDADQMPILPFRKVANQRLATSVVRVGLAPAAACRTEVLQYEIGVVLVPMGLDGEVLITKLPDQSVRVD